jgi:hypothetical protein
MPMNKNEMMRQAINKLDVDVRMPQRAKEKPNDSGILPKRLDFKSPKLLQVLKKSKIASSILGSYVDGGGDDFPSYITERLEEEIRLGAEEVKFYNCNGRFGDFVVSLMVWEGIFWVEARDYEKICYFTSIEDADSYASNIVESNNC